jgi:cell division protein FtsB
VNELSLEREGDVLDKEQTKLTREEHDLRLSLEDAGVHTQTVEERAKERIGVIASNAPETPEPSEGGAFGN